MNKLLETLSETLSFAAKCTQQQASDSPKKIDAAVQIYSVMRDCTPNLIEAYVEALVVLKRHKRFVEAADVVSRALATFPNAPWPISEAAALSFEREDYAAAILHAEEAGRRFPLHKASYVIGARSLRMARRFVDAERLLSKAATLFPDDVWTVQEALRLSQDQGDWTNVVIRSAALQDKQPDASISYLSASNALRKLKRYAEARSILTTAQERFRDQAWPSIQLAWLAHEVNDLSRALEIWRVLRTKFPDVVESYLAAGRTYLGLGQLDRAEDVFAAALTRFPDLKDPALELARTAELKGEWATADSHLLEARARFPNDPDISVLYATAPASVRRSNANKDWPEAIRRLQALNANLPDYSKGHAAHLNVLRRAGRISDAAELAQRVSAQFPLDIEIAIESSKIFFLVGDTEKALGVLRYLATHGTAPEPRVEAALASTLSAAGRYDEAEDVCRRGIDRSNDPELMKLFARIATRQGRSDVALARWQDAERQHPNDSELRNESAAAQFALTGDDVPMLARTGGRLHKEDLSSIAELVVKFESLGGTAQGCEFGLVQRKFGVEPIGLLRWSSMTLDPLLDALKSRFENVGEASQTQLDLYEHLSGDQEYRTSDLRFQMSMHTFINPETIPFDKMFVQSCRRLKFLKARILEDLVTADKIFVFKTGDRNHSVDEVQALFEALQDYGKNALLYVREQDETHLSGSVNQVQKGFMIGYLDHFSQIPGGAARAPNFSDWARLCVEANRLWH